MDEEKQSGILAGEKAREACIRCIDGQVEPVGNIKTGMDKAARVILEAMDAVDSKIFFYEGDFFDPDDPKPDHRVRLDGAKTMIDLYGALVKRHEITGDPDRPVGLHLNMADLSDKQLKALARINGNGHIVSNDGDAPE